MTSLSSARFLRIGLGVLLFAAGGATVFLFTHRPAPPTAPARAVGTHALENEVRRLRTELAAMAAVKAHDMQKVGAASAPPPAAEMSDEEAEAHALARQQAVYAAIESQLAREPVDPAWGPAAAEQLKDLTGKHAEFGTLASVRCAATLCKLVVSHRDVDDMRSFVERVAEDPRLEGQVVYRYDKDAQPPITTMFLSRKGHKLPRPPRG